MAAYKSEEHEQQRAKLAFAVANSKKLQKRINALEKEREQKEQQHEDQLRRVTALEREEAASAQECLLQLREMEDGLAKANQDLKSMQTQHEDLSKEFATQSGQLEAARKREVQAHESQEQLARQLMDTLDQVEHEEEELDKVKIDTKNLFQKGFSFAEVARNDYAAEQLEELEIAEKNFNSNLDNVDLLGTFLNTAQSVKSKL